MALFQISEPGEAHAKEACATGAVGIDLGTTNSLIAIVLGDGKPHALAVDEGSTLLPSVVRSGYFLDKTADARLSRLVLLDINRHCLERAARRLAAEFPRDTIVSVKRFMGRSSADPETRRLSPYRFAEGDSGVVRFVVNGGAIRDALALLVEPGSAVELRVASARHAGRSAVISTTSRSSPWPQGTSRPTSTARPSRADLMTATTLHRHLQLLEQGQQFWHRPLKNTTGTAGGPVASSRGAAMSAANIYHVGGGGGSEPEPP